MRQELFAIVTIHDACPRFSTKIFHFAEELEKLKIKYNIALVPFYREKQDLPQYPEFANKIKRYNAEIALHGLYHNNRHGILDDFHTRTKAVAEEEIRAGLEILQEVRIKAKTFVPPAWYLNNASIEVLQKLKFKVAETQKVLVLFYHNTYRKLFTPKTLNWDSYGEPKLNMKNLKTNWHRFNMLLGSKTKLLRIALHPKDPSKALIDQKNMILKLKEEDYTFLQYSQIIEKKLA
jgi:predicted deacetylase